MRYVGGKSRLAGQVRQIIAANREGRSKYIEPFVGGGATFARIAPDFTVAKCGDASEDLSLMWDAVSRGWLPPDSLTEAEYNSLRASEPSSLRGFAGFGCSFGGKWFGGYARGGRNADGTPRNHQAESYRAVSRLAPGFKGREVRHCDYRSWAVDADTVLYLDPPYAGTQGYGAVDKFDAPTFWRVAERWAQVGALVIVSEYSAPEGWREVHSMTHRQSLQHGRDGRPATVEKVWMPLT